jgi:hypothetical protein
MILVIIADSIIILVAIGVAIYLRRIYKDRLENDYLFEKYVNSYFLRLEGKINKLEHQINAIEGKINTLKNENRDIKDIKARTNKLLKGILEELEWQGINSKNFKNQS